MKEIRKISIYKSTVLGFFIVYSGQHNRPRGKNENAEKDKKWDGDNAA